MIFAAAGGTAGYLMARDQTSSESWFDLYRIYVPLGIGVGAGVGFIVDREVRR